LFSLRWRDFFRWVRLPTVFSSLCNAFAGWWIGGHEGLLPLWLGMAAAGLFLMAGMGMNDIADAKVDAQERPDRPLPSGAIPLQSAWMLVIAMFTLGLVLQGCAHPKAMGVGLALMLAIFAYNFAFKGTWLGPLAMGLCRALNLVAGMALNASFLWPWEVGFHFPPNAAIAIFSLGSYIALVTFLARDEVQGNAPLRIRIFLFGLGIWAGAWMAVGFFSGLPLRIAPSLLALFYLLGKPLAALWKQTSPSPTGRMVGALLRGIPLVDMLGLWLSGAPLPVALACLLFMLPGPLLMKRFYST